MTKQFNSIAATILVLATTQVHAISIAGIDGITLINQTDQVVGSSSTTNTDFQNQLHGNPISQATLHDNLTDTDLNSFVYSTAIEPEPWIDINLNSTFYNGDGADLVMFFAGSSNINLSINTSPAGSSIVNFATIELAGNIVDADYFSYPLTAALIDLDAFGIGFASSTKLDSLRIMMARTDRLPLLAMVGGFHTSPAAVPLPLSALLFASGLGLLALAGKQRARP